MSSLYAILNFEQSTPIYIQFATSQIFSDFRYLGVPVHAERAPYAEEVLYVKAA